MPQEKEPSPKRIDEQYILQGGGMEAASAKVIHHTVERRAFVEGLFQELNEQRKRYLALTGQRLELEARMHIVERNLRATRDHLRVILENSEEEVPDGWEEVLKEIRFVGARIGDACVLVLREQGCALTTKQLLHFLDDGQYRFRTGTPLREIHAALLRQPQVRRDGDTWVCEQIPTEKEEIHVVA